jgi:putative flavoprotein involved in K+ transport
MATPGSSFPDMSVGPHPADFDVVVVGAGQAGLAAGHYLAESGLRFVILEARESVGDNWRTRYDSLRLYTPPSDDALPGLRFPRIAGRFPTGRQMADYLEAYARHFDLPVETGVRVDRLTAARDGDGFIVTAGSRRYRAAQVIVATGAFQRPFIPDVAADLDAGIRQLHSAQYHHPGQLADGPVLVVGVSHSGTDIAYELAATRRTFLSGKSRGELPLSIDSRGGQLAWHVIKFLGSQLLTLRTPIGRRMGRAIRRGAGQPLLRYRLADLLKAGVVWHEARTVGARDGRPLLADGQLLDVANVVWCTGFRPDYSWIELPVLDRAGWPRQERGVVRSVSGLYVLGIPFLSGFTSMLILGAGRDAAHVARCVQELASRPRFATALAG